MSKRCLKVSVAGNGVAYHRRRGVNKTISPTVLFIIGTSDTQKKMFKFKL
jgi:hypothetical protein